jgi:hypothetical protein
MKLLLTVGALAVATSTQALAWGDEGHRIVCEIAFREAAPTTQDAITALIATDGHFTRFSDACTWPDHPRQRTTEHYFNLLRYAPGLADDTCPPTGQCVVSAIELDFGRLSLPAAGPATHLEALKFLGHWVGDVHQPLHVSFADDRGGGSVTTTGICNDNLHAAWDTCLVEQAVGTDPLAAADQLQPEITDGDRAAWIATGPAAWANESFAITTAPATGYCVASSDLCAYTAGNVALDPGEPQKTVTIDAAYVAASTRSSATGSRKPACAWRSC